MDIKLFVIAGAALCMLGSCRFNSSSGSEEVTGASGLEGCWIEVMPVNTGYVQGICLDSAGKAGSVGMATLLYDTWKVLDGNARLVLGGKSVGNGQTIEFSDTLDIVELSQDRLVLGKSGERGTQYRIQYRRSLLDFGGTYKGTIPAADCPGIDVTLSIGRNMDFHMMYDYLERDSRFESAGKIVLDGDCLVTVGDGADSTFYRIEKDALRMLDRDRQVITGDLADMYVLRRAE